MIIFEYTPSLMHHGRLLLEAYDISFHVPITIVLYIYIYIYIYISRIYIEVLQICRPI